MARCNRTSMSSSPSSSSSSHMMASMSLSHAFFLATSDAKPNLCGNLHIMCNPAKPSTMPSRRVVSSPSPKHPNAALANNATRRSLSSSKTLSTTPASSPCAARAQQSNAPPSTGVAKINAKYDADVINVDDDVVVGDGTRAASSNVFIVTHVTWRASAGDAAATAPNTRPAVAMTNRPLASSLVPLPHPPPQHPVSMVSPDASHAFVFVVAAVINVDSASRTHASSSARLASASPPHSLANIVVITAIGVVACRVSSMSSFSFFVAFGCARAARMARQITSKCSRMTSAPQARPMARTARAASTIFCTPSSGFKLSKACGTAHGANVGDAHIARSTASAS
mmetsp:Transcript_7944/g.29330  ORF Transcript_7944/g.29330 Transcript_7944/m.29330 type:complete len:341 (+) Transcript_7944:1594-2616(+)